MAQLQWNILNNADDKRTLLERLLAIRGLEKKEDINEFLNPLKMIISTPDAFSDMEKAVEKIASLIEKEQKILIYGDFDADGITSTSILLRTFKELGANVDYYIPDRDAEGHGMNKQTLISIMTKKKPKLIVTVDCGVSNNDEIDFLKTFNVDVIVTDHHEAPEVLPNAYAIINPKAEGSLKADLPVKKIKHLTYLAGCGVAFKLAQALLIHYEKTAFLNELFPYVALGTIADIVPLLGENRYFVQKGLSLIQDGKHYGLKRLLENAECTGDLTSEKIGFTVAPRINACGRLDSVDYAMKLMVSDNKQEIEMALVSLDNFNKVRQDLCEETFNQAKEMFKKTGKKDSAIVLFNKDWHVGIIGIVASKMVETFGKPTFLMTYSEKTNQFRCSARSIKGINLYDTICAIDEPLDGFGGHEMAAGLSFSTDKTSFEKVKKALNSVVEETLRTKTITPTLDIDCELSTDDVTLDLVNEIRRLEPFGAENATPTFCMKNLVIKEKKIMGSKKNHLRLTVQKDGKEFTCVWWSHADLPLEVDDRLDIAFCPDANVFNDNTYLQLMVKDVHSEQLTEIENSKNPDNIRVYNHKNKPDIFAQVEDYCMTSKMDIVVFAEDSDVLNKLKPYKNLSERVVSRKDLRNAESLMFFDYPADDDSYNAIIEAVSPKHIHYIHCDFKPFNDKEVVKTLYGMIRFACNNKNGEFPVVPVISKLAIDKNTLDIALEMFENAEMIDIIDRNEDIYTLSLSNTNDLNKILHSPKYEEFREALKEIETFKKSLFNVVCNSL